MCSEVVCVDVTHTQIYVFGHMTCTFVSIATYIYIHSMSV